MTHESLPLDWLDIANTTPLIQTSRGNPRLS